MYHELFSAEMTIKKPISAENNKITCGIECFFEGFVCLKIIPNYIQWHIG
jgi:hypothetical protein